MDDLKAKELTLMEGDCIERMKELEDGSIDCIITDPPYMIQLMHGKNRMNWDSEFDTESWAAECYRVLKAGGHIVAFSATRTLHKITSSLEGAGLEVRDCIHWIYGSGFPKNHDVGKAIDAYLLTGNSHSKALRQLEMEHGGESYQYKGRNNGMMGERYEHERKEYSLQTEEGKKWKGYGSCIKPAVEPAILCRKPLEEGSIVKQVLSNGCGALNIDAARIRYGDEAWPFGKEKPKESITRGSKFKQDEEAGGYNAPNKIHRSVPHPLGRYPANLYYCPKPSQKERDYGLQHLKTQKVKSKMNHRNGAKGRLDGAPEPERANFHLTVKPLKLMRYLVRLLAPPEGIVLDPFLGSGTTAMAAILEGHDCIGIERAPEYIPIIRGRVAWSQEEFFRENAQLKLF